MPNEALAFKIKTTNLPLFVLHALQSDMAEFKRQLQAHLAQAPDFFSASPVVVDLTAIAESTTAIDFADLASFMHEHGLAVAGVLGGSTRQREAARASGLGLFPDKPARGARKPVADEAQPTAEAVPAATISDNPAPPPAAAVMPEPEQVVASETPAASSTRRPTLVIDKPVRTGQRIHAEGGDLVVLAIVNAGAELIADGDIHVYAPLRGRALAGARGDTTARIFAQCMEAELVSIAGYFQVFEDQLPASQRSKPVQVFLDEDRITLQALTMVR